MTTDIAMPTSSRLSYHLCDITQDADIEFLFNLDQDPKVMRYITNGNTTSRATLENWFVPRIAAFTRADKGWGLWCVSNLDTRLALGWILIRPMNFFSDDLTQNPPQWLNLEIGWRFNQASWGKGYATEAAAHIIKQLSSQLNLQKFSATALIDNLASINIMQKIGMTPIQQYIHRDEYGEFAAVVYQKVL